MIICSQFNYVFYAELELNLNRYFIDDRSERWSLLFIDESIASDFHWRDRGMQMTSSRTLSPSGSSALTMYENAKIKCRCWRCSHEWASARGRILFRAERTEPKTGNILFVHLFSQICQMCWTKVVPSWYIDEIVRVMNKTCRVLIGRFYPNRSFTRPALQALSEDGNTRQRTSHMTRRHEPHFCRACQQDSCFMNNSNR